MAEILDNYDLEAFDYTPDHADWVEAMDNESAAKVVAEKICHLSGQHREAALKWIESNEEPIIGSHGYTTRSLMERHPGMTYPAALLTIDWLDREPEKAKSIIEKGIR